MIVVWHSDTVWHLWWHGIAPRKQERANFVFCFLVALSLSCLFWLSELFYRKHTHALCNCIGPGESGKSTVLKQMRIIHRKGPKREELESYKLTIYRNLIDAIKQTLRALDKMQVQFRTEDTAHYAKVISEFEFNDKDLDLRIPSEVVEGIRHFWYNTPLQKGFDAISRYSYVLESAP